MAHEDSVWELMQFLLLTNKAALSDIFLSKYMLNSSVFKQ